MYRLYICITGGKSISLGHIGLSRSHQGLAARKMDMASRLVGYFYSHITTLH